MRRSRQLTLEQARRPKGRGGWRPGAGRPRTRTGPTHDVRTAVVAREPQHVTLRLADGVRSIRNQRGLGVVHAAVKAVGHRPDFRVVHFNVLSNHVHMLVEAASSAALGRAMQALCIRLARGLNRVLGHSGTVFAERYHVRALRTPTEVRNALRYVLLNGNRHAVQRGVTQLWYGCDSYSTGAWFDGWADERWRHEIPDTPRPTAEPRTWLLREGWRKGGGVIEFDDTPGRTRRV